MWGSKMRISSPWRRRRRAGSWYGRGRGLGEGPGGGEVRGDGAARGGAFGGEVGQHPVEFAAGGAFGELGDGGQRDAGEQALEDGVPPGVRVQVTGGVRADGGGDDAGVVGAQGVLDQADGVGSCHGEGQRVEHGAAFGAAALLVEAGERGGAGAGRVEQQDAGGVGVVGADHASGLGEAALPDGQGPGAGVLGGLGEGGVEPGAGVGVELSGEGAADRGRVGLRRGGGGVVHAGSSCRGVARMGSAGRLMRVRPG